MSRIGKLPVTIGTGVKGLVNDGMVYVEGPKGKLSFRILPGVNVTVADDKFTVSMIGADKQTKANYGTTRASINNMVFGVTKGWKKSLELVGVGFNAKLEGATTLVLSVGFSHEVKLEIPKEIKCVVNKTTVDLESADRALLGTVAARIRKVWPPEPYLGKGIKYTGEKIRRKAGKTGKK